MTQQEQALEDGKIRAEIAKLMAETVKLNNEAAKLATENRWYLLVVGSGATLAIVAVAKVFL